MFKRLRHNDRVAWTGHYAKVAHRAQLQVIFKSVNRFFLFAIRLQFLLGDDLDGSVGAGNLAGLATSAAMLVILIMGHDHLTLETIEHLQRGAVIRILLRLDLFRMCKIIPGNPHACKQ